MQEMCHPAQRGCVVRRRDSLQFATQIVRFAYGGNSPVDCCELIFRVPRRKRKADIPNGISAFLVRRKGLEPPTY